MKLTATHIRRLKRLEALMHGVPKAKFNMDRWFHNPRNENTNQITECGSTACALGWGALDPVLQVEGLRSSGTGVPKFSNGYGTDAAMKFFGLSAWQADWLFMPNEYQNGAKGERVIRKATPLDVAKRLRMVLAGKVPRYPTNAQKQKLAVA